MLRLKHKFCLLLFFIGIFSGSVAMAQPDGDSSLQKLSPKFVEEVSKKADRIDKKLERKTAKMLSGLQREEARLQRKLSVKDSQAAQAVFGNATETYKKLQEKLSIAGVAKNYIPHFDSLVTSLDFLDKHGELISQAKEIKDKVKEAIDKTNALKGQLQKAEDVKQFLKERKEYLKQQLEKFGMVKDLKRINKEAYYYQQQVKEYVAIIKDPKKAEKKALELLSRTKLFQDFFKKNSTLASLFRMSGDPNDPAYIASLQGLQTRAQVNNLIQQQIQSAGPGGMQQLQQQVQNAQNQLNQWKTKILSRFPQGSGSSDDIMPEGFRPNSQKTKSFLQRLELGTNIQTQKATSFFPVTSDIGLSLGYRINDRSVIGLGGSFKMGWGRGWEHIRLSGEGVGLRSFIDVKIKGGLWISGGYELNYKSAFRRMQVLKDLNAWQRSGLVGLSKTIPIKTKFFRQTRFQFLWDFMSRQNTPATQQFIFRTGYNF